MANASHINSDYVLKNGKIYTLDCQNHTYSSMAIKGNKIIYLGNSTYVKNYIGPCTTVIDLKGKIVLPSFCDSHMHPPGANLLCKYGVNLSLVSHTNRSHNRIIRDYLSLIKEYAHKHPDVEIIYGYGWCPSVFPGIESTNGPRRERLDDLDIDKPIVLYSYDNHTIWLNTKAFEVFDITVNTSFIDENKPCKNIVKDINGLWGTIKEDAFIFVPTPKYSINQYVEEFLKFQRKMHKLGITSISNIYVNYMAGFMPFKAYQKLIDEDLLMLRVSYSETISPHLEKDGYHITIEHQLKSLLRKRKYSSNSEFFRVTGAKIFIDGVVDTKTALLSEPYEQCYSDTEPCSYGYNLWHGNERKLINLISQLNSHGFQAHFHTIGDAAVSFVLDIFKNIPCCTNPINRNILTHLQLVRKDDIKLINLFNFICSLQTFWGAKENTCWDNVDYKLLGPRAEFEYPLKSLGDAGIIVAGSSDYPITEVPNPLTGIKIGITRNDNLGAPLNTCEAESLYHMINIYTKNAAFANGVECKIGSLELGKCADLIVLSDDLYEISPCQIDSVKVLMTFFNGEIVYCAR